MKVSQWAADFRWAMNMMRARSWRRRLGFTQRQLFDEALRPAMKLYPADVFDYPDAIYHIGIDDLTRAMAKSVGLLQPQGALEQKLGIKI